jgi:hypothetical protein
MFSETMVGVHGAEPPAVAAAYDFSGLTTIVDVGGATGHLLTTILKHYPGSRGILFDLPHVVRDAPPLIQARGLAERVTIEAGNLFEGVPSGGDRIGPRPAARSRSLLHRLSRNGPGRGATNAFSRRKCRRRVCRYTRRGGRRPVSKSALVSRRRIAVSRVEKSSVHSRGAGPRFVLI